VSTRHPAPTEDRLRASPSFVQALTLDGRPYVAKETEPYIQYWLSERERLLLSLFMKRGGVTASQAITQHTGTLTAQAAGREAARSRQAIAGMLQAGVLMRSQDDTSRYDAAIVRDYVKHRPIPPEIAAHIVQCSGMQAQSRVLDLAGGPGDLALALAATSGQVSLMELSRGFLAAGRARARARGLPLQTIHDSCNRLVFRDETYDVATVCQALHWLDDVQLCRGLARVLNPDGSFFVVHSAIDLPDDHPLAYLLGHDSILGRKQRQSLPEEVAPLLRRLSLLFEALDASPVQRVDFNEPGMAAGAAQRIAPAGVALFKQPRPFDAGYARGFLTPAHIAATGMAEAHFWADLQARCAAVSPARMVGTHHWAVLHFQRGAKGDLGNWAQRKPRQLAYTPGDGR